MRKLRIKLLAVIICLLVSMSFAPQEVFAAPVAPTSLSATAVSSTQINLTWNYVSDATYYYIYRSTAFNGNYTNIGTATSTSYVDSGLAAGTTYYYQVRAYNSSGSSPNSAITYVTTAASASLSGLTATVTGASQIYLAWNAFNSASSYTVSRATSYDGPYYTVGTTSSINYTDTGLSSGTTYYYKVLVVDSYGTSSYSAIVSATTLVSSSTSQFTAEVTGSNQVYLSWLSVASASYYRLSRSTAYAGPYSQFALSNSNSYTDDTVALGVTYYYKLEAVSSSGGLISSYIASATPYAQSTAAGLTAVATGTGQIYLSWNSFNSAAYYAVWRTNASDQAFASIGTTSSTTYTDTGLTSGITYYYKIQAVDSYGNSSYSSVVSAATLASSAITQFTAEVSGPNQIYLYWPEMSSAYYYRVSRATSASGPFTILSTINSTTYYSDNGVYPGVTYYYKLEAIDSAGSVINTSPVVSVSTSSGSSSTQIPSDRLAGANRYETANNICQAGWNTSYYAVIVSGENYPDALCSSPLAYKYNAPILLTPKDSLDAQTKAQLTRLNVKGVFLIGGTGVISDNTEQAIRNMGITVSRIAGSDRYDTSLKIAQALGAPGQIVLTSGDNFPDVLSIAPIAALKGMPILLTPGTSLSNNLKLYLQNSVQKTYVLGGSSVISDNVFSQLPSPERLNGANRYENNINIVRKFLDQLDVSTCYLATGESYPDALAGSALAALTKSPLILVSSTLDPTTLNFIQEKKSAITKIKVFGGTGAVPDSVLTNIAGSGSANITLATPTNVAATCLNASQIYLTWSAVGNATSYSVYRSLTAAGSYSYVGSISSTSYADTGLSASTTYYYKVMAVNSNGSSGYSSYVYATTAAQ